jgi:hypothetical protein
MKMLQKFRFKEPFVAITRSVLRSPRLMMLSPAAKLIIMRLMVEYDAKGGRTNREMKVSSRQLKQWCGAADGTIRAAIAELRESKLVKVKMGVSGLHGRTTQYGLNWLPKVGVDCLDPDHNQTVANRIPRRGKRGSGKSIVPSQECTITVPLQEGTMELIPTSGCVQNPAEKGGSHAFPGVHYLNSSYPAQSNHSTKDVTGPAWTDEPEETA